jgi:hypothetical protein
VPLFHVLPEVPYMSFERIDATLGSTRTVGGETISYLTLPRACPNGGFPVRTELVFAGPEGLAQQTVTGESEAPCPAGSEALAETSVRGTGGVVTMPPDRVCVSGNDFTVHVRQRKGLIYRRVSVDVNGRSVAVMGGSRASAAVRLRSLPRGRYVVRVAVAANTGRQITGTRTYHTCAFSPPPAGIPDS